MITRAVRDDKHGSRTPRRRTLLLLGMLVVLLWVHVQLGAQVDLVDHHLGGDTVRAAEAKLIERGENKEYAGIVGLPNFVKVCPRALARSLGLHLRLHLRLSLTLTLTLTLA